MAKRVALAGLGVVLLSGAATAVLALNEVNKVVEALHQNKAVKLAPRVLAPTSRGGPETLLLVGDDRRPPPKSNPGGFVLPHSNEMLLVRIDPGKPTISMLSIPRELQVTIYPPGALPVTNRINAAYTIGGIQLMTETIKHVLGIPVNHVFVVTFPKFKRAVDEMGCVYLPVDRRYYHVNEPGSEQFFEINLQPGYQRMCGRESLEFVANRHEDTSLTRDARDQRFLLETKAQYGGSLFENREKFERVLGRAVETDLHGSGSVLDLLALLVQAQGKPVRRVHFQVNLLPTYDTASTQQIQESISSFLNGTAPIPKYRLGHALRGVHSHARGKGPPIPSLVAVPDSSLSHARSQAPSLPFPLEYPRYRHPYVAAGSETLRRYAIRDPQGHLHPSYVIVTQAGSLGQYYDIEGTSWSEPPLLANPSQAVHAGTRTYELFYEGEQMRTIAWHEGSGTYWVENTLTNDLSPREMLAIAEQTLPVVSQRAPRPTGVLSLRNVPIPKRPARTTSSDVTKIGTLVGLVGLAGLLVLAWSVLARGRELSALRAQIAQAVSLEARQRALLAASAPVAPARPAPAPGAAAPAHALAGTSGAAAHARPSARSVYRARRRARRSVLAGGIAVLAMLGVGVYLLARGAPAPAPPARGPVPVAVYNATSTTGTASKIAATLRANHVHVARLGDIKNANLGHGAYVLYPPGTAAQARSLAQLIPSLTPTVTPIQPQLQSTVGRHGEIVIVLD
jgi:LCP family protein required for cell wall assembly